LAARLADIDADPQRAVQAWMVALEEEAAMDVMGQANEARMRCAHSLLALGRKKDAARVLAPVFERVGTVLDANADFTGPLLAGTAVCEGLAAFEWGDLLGPDELAQLRYWRDWSRRITVAAPETRTGSEAIVVPRDFAGLSSREHEVLQRIAAGDSNKLIARAFELSPHTVKRHVANILDKLALQSRGQAAAWYRSRDSA
jgi:LuxR family maltose regulon positive regulatory protein